MGTLIWYFQICIMESGTVLVELILSNEVSTSDIPMEEDSISEMRWKAMGAPHLALSLCLSLSIKG